MIRLLTDAQIKDIYARLIAKSWERSDNFEPYQDAWHQVAEVLGVDGIENNGHGRVKWAAATQHSGASEESV